MRNIITAQNNRMPLVEYQGQHKATFVQLGFYLPLRYQPFGSMPRDCNSLRKIRFIQVARDVSPSFRASFSSCARSSWDSLSWYWSVLGFSLDIVITRYLLSEWNCNYIVIADVLQFSEIAKPGSAATLTGLLTTPLRGLTLWLIRSLPKLTPDLHGDFWRFPGLTDYPVPAAFLSERTASRKPAAFWSRILFWSLLPACRYGGRIMRDLLLTPVPASADLFQTADFCAIFASAITDSEKAVERLALCGRLLHGLSALKLVCEADLPPHLIERLTVDKLPSAPQGYQADSFTLLGYCQALTQALLSCTLSPETEQELTGLLFDMVDLLVSDLKAPRFVRERCV
jgi:hypothetical protein